MQVKTFFVVSAKALTYKEYKASTERSVIIAYFEDADVKLKNTQNLLCPQGIIRIISLPFLVLKTYNVHNNTTVSQTISLWLIYSYELGRVEAM